MNIVAPLPGSPAAKAGVRAGDLILQIDGARTEGMTLTEAVNRIRGERGTKVKLLLGREGATQPIVREIMRGPIELPTVETRMLDDRIGYMRVNYFYDDTGRSVTGGLKELREKRMRGLVLDLRNNPGGLLNRCVEVVRQFVAEEPVVYVQERGQPMRPFRGEGSGAGHRFELPLVVLINKGSASGSEILAGAIQDAKVGRLVGATTYGKGSVQTILPLRDGAAIALTTSKWYTLARRDISRKGIAPDVAVDMPAEVALDGPDDVQYKKALELLRQQVAALRN
jgi:carboxyl-terminal processing protease